MGSRFSGRRGPRDRKPTTDEFASLDIRVLNRNGTLQPGECRSYAWNRAGVPLTRVTVHTIGDALRITSDDGWSEWVEIDHTPCTYGGSRPWFRCPGADCSRRVAILYVAEIGPLCRHCLGLAYQVCREDLASRLFRKAIRIRAPLERSELYQRFGMRPGGMHRRTFAQLQNDANAAELKAMALTVAAVSNVL